MKNIRIIFFVLALFAFGNTINAQSRLQFSDIYLFNNAGSTFTNQLNNSEIFSLEKNLFAPGIVNPSNSKKQRAYGGNGRYYGNIGMMAGWNIRGARLGNQKLRLGFSSGRYQLDWNSYTQEDNTYIIDTLISQQTGKEIYIDSVHSKSLDYKHSAQMFNLHADYLLYINPQNKFSFYTGIGASVGFSLSNTVSATYREYDQTKSNKQDKFDNDKIGFDEDWSKDWSKDNESEYRSKSISPAFNYNLHSLVGVNYRISKRNRFLKNMNLFAEMKMGLEINQMNNINSSAGFNFGGQSGLRVALNTRSKSFRKKPVRKKSKRRRY